MPAPTPYDEVTYPGWPFPQAQPDRLATLARLFGMAPADPANCRVLELGCGDGGNAMAVACSWPGSRVVGVDLAPGAIARGRALAAEAGIANVDLRVGDIARLPADLGEFDYVVAHGVYSWVPEPVRAALLDACRRFLAPHFPQEDAARVRPVPTFCLCSTNSARQNSTGKKPRTMAERRKC